MTTKISALPANQQIAWAAGAAVTVSTPLLNLTQTWNNVATTFTAGLINVTDTASAAGSRLLALQLAGADMFYVRKDGAAFVQDGSAVSPSLGWVAVPTAGFLRVTGGQAGYASSGNTQFVFGTSSGNQIVSSAAYGWASSATNAGAAGDLFLFRDAANTLALRNGVSANSFKVANSFTDTSNADYGVFDWISSANVLTIGTVNNGTFATARNLRFVVGGVSKLDYGVTTAGTWTTPAGADFTSGGSLHAGASSVVGWTGRLEMESTADGVLKLENQAHTNSATITVGAANLLTFQGPVKPLVTTVASLPTGSDGMRANVTDATATTFQSIVAGGGANHVPVFHDGTNWRIG